MQDYKDVIKYFCLQLKSAAALGLLLCSAFATAHPGYYGTAFHAHTIEQAKSIAARENKLIFVYAGDGARGWRYFRWPTGDTAPLIDLLVRETVIVELDYIEENSQLAEYELIEPGILVLDNKGALIKSFAADTVADLVEAHLRQLVGSDEGLARIDAAIASGKNPYFNRERRAAALALAGRYKAALEAYDRCLSDAIDETSPAAKSRRGHVIDALNKLSAQDKSALDILHNNRARAAQRLQSNPENARLAGDIARIDRALGKSADSLVLFDQLPAASRARRGMFDYVSDELRRKQRYRDLLALIDPAAAIDGEIALYERHKILKPVSAERGQARGSRQFVIDRGLALIEALAGVNRDTECETLMTKLLQFDAGDATRQQIAIALQRAGRSDLNR